MVDRVKRCIRCILPTTTPNISIDQNGVCNYCRIYSKFKIRGEKSLLKILEKHRDPQKKYECIVNISGGRDSSFTLLKLKKDYDMKVLAINYENPFTHNQAVHNIINMVRSLNIDIIQFKHKSRIHETCFKNNLIAWLKNPSPAMVPMMCIGCKIIWPTVLHIAKAYDISLIVNGGNPYEYTSFKKELLNVSAEEDLQQTYFKYIIGLYQEVVKNVSYLSPQYIPVLLKGYLFNNQYALGSRMLGRHIDQIDLFHFIEWNEQNIISRIMNELAWDFPHDYQSTWRFDCKIGHLKDIMYTCTLGMTEKDDFYAKMIRENLIKRSDALQRLKIENTLHWDVFYEILRRFGISLRLLRRLRSFTLPTAE